ncbi:MAG: hypothetical protein LBR08_00865 [Bacteroidales bacterium]|jgi:hypothetical protein|nr:hypothetical protein [Bacteroidales bacterium]
MKRINFKLFPCGGLKLAAMIASLCVMIFMFSCDNKKDEIPPDTGEEVVPGEDENGSEEDENGSEEDENGSEEDENGSEEPTPVYIAPASSLQVYPGYGKIKFEWQMEAEPPVVETVICWNGCTSSVTVPTPADRTPEAAMEYLLENIAEGEYVFEFVLRDSEGNVSEATSTAGVVFGYQYAASLPNRGVSSIVKLPDGDMEITWEPVSSATLQYMVVEYGLSTVVEAPNEDATTVLTGLSSGEEIRIHAVHLPENALETINANSETFIMPKTERLLDKSLFSDAFKPGDNTTPDPGGATNDWTKPITDTSFGRRCIWQLWDGGTRNATDNKSILHTSDNAANFKFPHQFTFDIGVLATLSRIRVWPRVDNASFSGHSPRYFEIWATDVPKAMEDFADQPAFEQYYRTTYVVHNTPDGQIQANASGDTYKDADPAPGIYNWQEDWVKLGDFEMAKPSGLPFNQRNADDDAVWEAGFDFDLLDTGEKYQYIRLVIKYPNWQHSNCVNLGEISLYGDDI